MVDVNEFFTQAAAVFEERHRLYGSNGMDMEKAISLASTKLDRIKNGGAIKDSLTDLANYALIMSLIYDKKWEGMDEAVIDNSDKIQIHRVDQAKQYELPKPKKPGDCGFDMYCVEDTVVPANNAIPVNVPTGISVKLPDGYWADIRSRSSAAKRGFTVISCTIDNGYTGPLYACVHNHTGEDITVKAGERLSQFVLHKIHTPEIVEVDELPTTDRGATGFGSTGK